MILFDPFSIIWDLLLLGIRVKMVETFGTTQAVDVPEDVDKVLEIIND